MKFSAARIRFLYVPNEKTDIGPREGRPQGHPQRERVNVIPRPLTHTNHLEERERVPHEQGFGGLLEPAERRQREQVRAQEKERGSELRLVVDHDSV